MRSVGLTVAYAFMSGEPDPIPGEEHGEGEYELIRRTWPAHRARHDIA